MNTLRNRLRENSKEIPWTDVLTYITGKTLEIFRRGDPVEEIWPTEDEDLEPSYLLQPLLCLNHPSVIFGDYGSLKSLFGLVIAYVLQLPYRDNNLDLITPRECTHCLYLDYEDDPSTFRKRWSAIQRGFGIDAPMPILYRRMTTTIADSIEQLRRIRDDNDIKLLIIDSLGPAARGNLNDPEPAIRYYGALRQLGITSLTFAHTAKDQLTKRRSIFGSVFFNNLARSVWECKSEQEVGEDEAVISLRHTKANLSRLHPQLGYRFAFTSKTIRVAKVDLSDTVFSEELPLKWQIMSILREGSLGTSEIAERLSKKLDTVARTLRRLREKNQVTNKEDGTWAITG